MAVAFAARTVIFAELNFDLKSSATDETDEWRRPVLRRAAVFSELAFFTLSLLLAACSGG
ncbi:MAG: hypothetical protein ACR2H1_12795 [Limisphaerales bacterium]